MSGYTVLRILQWWLVIFVISSANTFAVEKDLVLKHETDSLRAILNGCNADTCKFAILSHYYWQKASSNEPQVNAIGLWAFEVIKSSSNLRARSDGFDIRGNIYEKERNYDLAAIFYRRALNLSKSTGYDFRTSWSLYKLGKLKILLNQPDSAIYYLKEFIEFSNSKSLNAWLSTQAYYEIALVFDHLQQADSVQKYKLKHDELYHKENEKERINAALKRAESNIDLEALSINYYQIGEVFYSQKKHRLALTYFAKALEICPPTDREFESCLSNFIGSIYLELGNDSLALFYTLKGFRDAWDIGYKPQIAASFRNLGAIYKLRGE